MTGLWLRNEESLESPTAPTRGEEGKQPVTRVRGVPAKAVCPYRHHLHWTASMVGRGEPVMCEALLTTLYSEMLSYHSVMRWVGFLWMVQQQKFAKWSGVSTHRKS